MLDVEVIDQPDRAIAALDGLRARILARLAEPGSATSVARDLGETRQKVNYHLRELERHGLVELVEERPKRGVVERVVVASARSYAVSPSALGDVGADPARTDRLSSSYVIALAGRVLREVGRLARRADEAGRPLATLAIDTDIRFATAADRASFTAELADAVTDLASRYHVEDAPGGRWHRLCVLAHPRPPSSTGRGRAPKEFTDDR